MIIEETIIILILGSFSIAVFWWDGLITYIELKKTGSWELNPVAKFWMDELGVVYGLLFTRLLASAFVLVLMFYEVVFLRSLVVLGVIALFEAWLVGWHISADYHIQEIRKTLKASRSSKGE